jgi:type IV pilus assembly protein PilO
MKLLFSKRDKLIIAAILLLLVIFIVTAQFYFLNPLKSDLKGKEQTLTSEQKQLEEAGKKNGGTTVKSTENTSELQKKLPVKPLQDQFILDLEKAETVSNSKIKSMNFTDSGQTGNANSQSNSGSGSSQQPTSQSSLGAAGQQSTSGTTLGTAGQQTSGTSSGATQPQRSSQTSTSTVNQQTGTSSAMPAGLNKLTAQLNVESPSYEDFEKFIGTLESLKRIVMVESITYTGSSEVTSLSQNIQLFSYNLTVSAFYMPELTDLQPQLPKVDYPAPANKQNPLSQFPDTQSP